MGTRDEVMLAGLPRTNGCESYGVPSFFAGQDLGWVEEIGARKIDILSMACIINRY